MTPPSGLTLLIKLNLTNWIKLNLIASLLDWSVCYLLLTYISNKPSKINMWL